MNVKQVSLIKKAMKSFNFSDKSVLSAREGPGWAVLVTVWGKKHLYYIPGGEHYPSGEYGRVIKGKRSAHG